MDDVWRKSKNDNAIWRPGISRAEMEKRFTLHILVLVEDLRSGAYQPDPTRSFLVNRGDGTSRTITAFTLRDKVAQRAVLAAIEPIGERFFHTDSYAYRPGRNIDMVIARIKDFIRSGYLWAVSADILQCFDNIPLKKLMSVTGTMICDDKVLRLIGQWIGLPRSAFKRFFSANKGIPQGAVISPYLCNVYLTALDEDLAAKKVRFVRYADNIFAMARSREDAYDLETYLALRLRGLGLDLNPEKTRIVHCGSPEVLFLGRSITTGTSRGIYGLTRLNTATRSFSSPLFRNSNDYV